VYNALFDTLNIIKILDKGSVITEKTKAMIIEGWKFIKPEFI